MRKFILWNYNKSSSFDFTSNSIIISDVSGLGVNFETTILNGVVADYERTFEDIVLLLNAGVEANAYTKFSLLTTFIAANGKNKFLLEYQFNSKTFYVDVWVARVSKTQLTEFNVLTETMVLKRMTEWYTMLNGIVPLLESGQVEIINPLFAEMPVTLYAQFTTNGSVYIGLYYPSLGSAISAVCITGLAGDIISIYSDKKKVTCTNGGVVTNGYNKIIRTQDTFMMVPQGTYKMAIYNQSGTVSVDYFYGKPVLD